VVDEVAYNFANGMEHTNGNDCFYSTLHICPLLLRCYGNTAFSPSGLLGKLSLKVTQLMGAGAVVDWWLEGLIGS